MAAYTVAELRHLMEESERLWNGGDREAWLALWRAAVPGEYVHESPVGAAPKRGFESARVAVWDEFQPTKMHTRQLIVCGQSVATLTESIFSVDGEPLSIFSIDTYDFDSAGNCHERIYVSIPS